MIADFQIVPAGKEHRTFVVTTWLESFYESYFAGTFAWKGTPGYEAVYRPSFEGMLDRPTAKCRVVTLASDPSLFVAWCLTDHQHGFERISQPILHYVYVKGPYRRAGIATELIVGTGIDPRREFRFSHRTRDWDRMTQEGLRKKDAWLGARFDPTMARYATPPQSWKQGEAR